jgi:REP element-mobilizing transposase RayT
MTFDSRNLPGQLYFITASVSGWQPVFAQSHYAWIPLHSLDWLRKQGRTRLYAFVIMPTHIHAVVQPTSTPIGRLLQDFGSFTAHKLIHDLQQDQNEVLLANFHEQNTDPRHQHRVWQDIQAKNIFTKEFLVQKLEYLHSNPINKDWHLVKERADYPYSSAGFYDRGAQPCIEVDDLRLFF